MTPLTPLVVNKVWGTLRETHPSRFRRADLIACFCTHLPNCNTDPDLMEDVRCKSITLLRGAKKRQYIRFDEAIRKWEWVPSSEQSKTLLDLMNDPDYENIRTP
jgi:hypothetical protein